MDGWMDGNGRKNGRTKTNERRLRDKRRKEKKMKIGSAVSPTPQGVRDERDEHEGAEDQHVLRALLSVLPCTVIARLPPMGSIQLPTRE